MEEFAGKLAACKMHIGSHCSALEEGLGDCAELLHDKESRHAMKKCRKTAADIKAVLSAVDQVLEQLEYTMEDPEALCDVCV